MSNTDSSSMVKVVIYSSKSTEDVHGSLGTQETDCRALAEREGWEVVGTFSDEAFSAYSGNRGPGLERAKSLAVQTAGEDGGCVLVAQDADRFARGSGDAPGAADHLGEVYFAMKRQRVTLWSVRSGQLDLLRATLEGERSTGESARKSQSVKAGLKRRAERGQPVGAIPIGYRVEDSDRKDSPRVIDPEDEALVSRMFEMAKAGNTPGEVSRRLNTEGATTTRGGPWTTRSVRRVLTNPDYTGTAGYPTIIDGDTFERVQELLSERARKRTDGRRTTEAFPLSGIAFCAKCGAAMRSRRCSTTGRRTYRCSNAMEGRNSCPDSVPVPADAAEAFLMGGLASYVGDLDAFLLEQTAAQRQIQQDRERHLGDLREQLSKLDRTRERMLVDYRAQVDAGRSTAYLALEAVEGLDREREAVQRSTDDAQALVDEHAGEPDLDAARGLYERLMAFAQGELERAATPAERGSVLRRVLTEVRMDAVGRIPVVEADLLVVEPDPQTLVNGEFPTTVPLPLPRLRIPARPDRTAWAMPDSVDVESGNTLG